MEELTVNTQWFVTGAYSVAGRPEMEAALMDFCKERYLYHLVYEGDLDHLIGEITQHQTYLHNQNKRWAAAEISLTNRKRRENDDLIWLHIGAQHLTLQRVKGVF